MSRDDRLDTEDPSVDDTRSNAERDRDRVLYSSAFRRLGAVTQVVSASEGLVIHNRLTHTLKVAQVARRLAERLLVKTSPRILRLIGGLNPDVTETAALGHDLGHPPFGHIAEEELNRLAIDPKTPGRLPEGFEGNAQSFRIVARQSVRTTQYTGLNLTRATLNAILKYPWLHGKGTDPKRFKKWGAYDEDRRAFDFARAETIPFVRSPEAEIMDWADDIAYALHDTEDFYRAGLIPLDRLVPGRDEEERKRFLLHYFAYKGITTKADRERADRDLANAIGSLAPRERFSGSAEQRATLRSWISNRIGEYIRSFSLRSRGKSLAVIESHAKREIDILKQLTWYYVIRNPALATQQAGQRSVIRELFRVLRASASEQRDEILPQVFQYRLRTIRESTARKNEKEQRTTRLILDLIASMTEEQALKIHHKLVGISPGSVMDQVLHHSIG